MAGKRFAKNIMIISVASASMALFTYIFVEHHRDTPNRVQQDRQALLSGKSDQTGWTKHVAQIKAASTNNTSAKLNGQQVYMNTCVSCHGAGIAGAPKLGDANQWDIRIAKGRDVLYTSATNGLQGSTGVMPAKGGDLSLSDAEVKAAVDYILAQLK